MEKKIIALVLAPAMAMALSLVACGGSSSGTTTDDTGETSAADVADESAPEEEGEEAEPLDLTGTWGYEEDELSVSAVIDEDSVIVYIYTLGSMWTYWAGSYEAPADCPDEYTWTSAKDASMIGDDTLSNPADTLEFTYQNEALTFTFDLDTGDEPTDLVLQRR